MSSNQKFAELAKPFLNLKIICGALIAGVVGFGFVLCTILDFENLNTDLNLLVAMATGFGMVMFMMSFVMFKMLSGQTRSKTASPESHFGVIQTAWIVRFAMIEGACFLNLIVAMLHQSLITLFVAVLGILVMVIGFPRTSVVEEILEDRMRG